LYGRRLRRLQTVTYTITQFNRNSERIGEDTFQCDEWDEVYLPDNDDLLGDDSLIGDDSLYNDYDGGCDTDSRRIMIQDDSENESEYLFIVVNTTVDDVNNDGGFVCLSQSDTRGDIKSLLKYGDTGNAAIPDCNGAEVEDIKADTSETPGSGSSFQRIGTGSDPTAFTWIVAPETPGKVNKNQKLPNKFDNFGTGGGGSTSK
jgi:hypothetical protein